MVTMPNLKAQPPPKPMQNVEIDDFHNPSCKQKIFRKRGDARGSPASVAGPSHLGAISISSDSVATGSVGDPGPSSSSGFETLRSSTSASACLQCLQTGQGLTSEQWMGVCARCPKCDKYYLRGKFFEKHECVGLLDI